MNDGRPSTITDHVVRMALAKDAPRGTEESFWLDLTAALGETPQRQRRLFPWPWTPVMPGVEPPLLRRRGVAVMVVLAILAAASIAVVGVIGSIQRLPAPFGLARAGLIAFDLGGDIFVSNADGTGRRQLTSGPVSEIQPTFSPDGTKIAYESLGLGGATVEIFVMDADGTDRVTIATKPAVLRIGNETSIGWRRLSWSPDSRSLTYSGLFEGRPQVFVARADGSGATWIGDRALEGQDPVWSPDGQRIAFRGGRFDRDRGIYVMNPDGSGVRRLVTPPDDPTRTYSYLEPTWSPDGKWLSYANVPGLEHDPVSGAYPGYYQQVWIAGVDDGVERAISTATGWSDNPAWSPDGSRLAYFKASAWSSSGVFVVVRPDGSGESEFGSALVSAPMWSPDGHQLFGRVDTTGVGYAYDGRDHGIVVIDVGSGTSAVLPGSSAGEGPMNEAPGIGSWQRLAD
jgi:TolB protein